MFIEMGRKVIIKIHLIQQRCFFLFITIYRRLLIMTCLQKDVTEINWRKQYAHKIEIIIAWYGFKLVFMLQEFPK